MKVKKSIFIFVFLLFLIFGAAFALPHVSARAASSSSGGREVTAYESSGDVNTNYWFQRIDTEIEVRKDKTFAVKEKLQVGFYSGGVNTGIIRDIQRVSQTTHIIDGVQTKGEEFLTDLTDVKVTLDGSEARVTRSYYNQGQFFSIKMQKPDGSYFEASNGTSYHTFELSYIYDMGQDKTAGYDDFTFDVLGYAMNRTRIFSARITFPEGTDLSKTTFRTNNKQEWEPDLFDPSTGEGTEIRSVKDNVIRMLATPNSANTGYTVQVILPDGYFTPSETYSFWFYWPLVALAACAVPVGLFIFALYSPRKGIEPVTVSPPEGVRAMRYSSIWHGKARDKDVAAVVAQWADEGYIRIEQDGKKDLILYRTVKELPECLSESERDYFEAMFPEKFGCDTFSTKEMRRGTAVSCVSRQRTMRFALSSLTKESDVPDPLKKGNGLAYFLMTVCALLPMIAFVVYLCLLMHTALPLFFAVFMIAGTAVGVMQARSLETPIAYIFPIAFMGMPFGVMRALFTVPRYDYIGLIYIALAIWAIFLVLMHFMKRRSPEAQRTLGEMRGFKRFILTAELSRIEALYKEDPDYFSHIIPYCLIMGVSEKVAKRFKALGIALPDWASAVSAVGFSSFSRSFSSSSGGSSGGGGHGGSSGGGGGGGGSRGC